MAQAATNSSYRILPQIARRPALGEPGTLRQQFEGISHYLTAQDEERRTGTQAKRLGVNQEDFDTYNLVRLNPKKKDRRFAKFQEEHGDYCAEIDALPPNIIRDRVRGFIEGQIPPEEWQRLKDVEAIETESFQSLLAGLGGAT